MKKIGKAIQTILMKHKQEIFDLISEGASINELDKVVQECLDQAKATGNDSVDEARMIFADCKRGGYNRYVSTLMTYLTGIAVGR